MVAMNVDWLSDFQVLAETGNFTLAAQRRNVSQAAFSRRMQALEVWVGVSLVNRENHPVTLTHAGQKFLLETREILFKLNETRTTLSNPDLGKTANVRIAMPHALSGSRFAGWWQKWSTGTRMSASLSVGNVSQVIAEFIAGGSDILICHSSMELPILADLRHYRCHVMEPDRFSLYASKAEAKWLARRFPGTESEPLPFVQYSEETYFARLSDLIVKRAPDRLNRITQIEADLCSVVKECVEHGFGIGWLPESFASRQHRDVLRELPVEGWSMDLTINAYMHRKGADGPTSLLWDRIAGGAA